MIIVHKKGNLNSKYQSESEIIIYADKVKENKDLHILSEYLNYIKITNDFEPIYCRLIIPFINSLGHFQNMLGKLKDITN